jgi:hypothetical protein
MQQHFLCNDIASKQDELESPEAYVASASVKPVFRDGLMQGNTIEDESFGGRPLRYSSS